MFHLRSGDIKLYVGISNLLKASKTYLSSTSVMANSKWDYVKKFELDDTLLPNSFAVARIDGRGNPTF